MSSLWPWVVVAGAGALHGLNPATGWVLAAGCGLRSGDRRQAWRALVPIAVGHLVSVVVVATAVARGQSASGWAWPVWGLAAGAGLVLALRGWRRHDRTGPTRWPAAAGGRVGLALWSFAASTAHGSGMMLVPALVPLCVTGSPAGELTASGSLTVAVAAVAVHAAAMLATLALAAVGAGRAVGAVGRIAAACRRARPRGQSAAP